MVIEHISGGKVHPGGNLTLCQVTGDEVAHAEDGTFATHNFFIFDDLFHRLAGRQTLPHYLACLICHTLFIWTLISYPMARIKRASGHSSAIQWLGLKEVTWLADRAGN